MELQVELLPLTLTSLLKLRLLWHRLRLPPPHQLLPELRVE